MYVYPKAAGEITEIKVKAGDSVKEGDVLCVIDTDQLESAQNSLKSAELSMNEAQNELNRQTVLYQNGGISEQSYEQYKNQAESARLQYENTEINYNLQLEYSYVKAQISGTIESVDMEVFDQVSSANLLCVLSGEGDKIVTFSATERVRDGLAEGDTIEIIKDSENIDGSVIELSSMPDDDTGLYKVKAAIPEDADISTGATVKVKATVQKAEGVMSVNADDVYYEGGKSYVYTYDNGTVHKKEIETGISDNVLTEVKSGIDYSELVITTWSSELYEGAEIKLKEEEDEASENEESVSAEGGADAAGSASGENGGEAAETSSETQE